MAVLTRRPGGLGGGGRGVTVGGVESSARPRPVGHGDADPGGGVADQAGEGDTAGGPGPG